MAFQLRYNGAQLEQCKEIMKSHKCTMPISSEEVLWERLREGVLVDGDKGEFDMRKLTVGTEYEVFFDIEFIQGAQGWNYTPVTFEHNSSFGLVTKFEKKLDDLIAKGRVQVPIGMFKLPCLPIGTPCSTIRMYEHGIQWKNGLIMRGVIIRPAMEVNHYN